MRKFIFLVLLVVSFSYGGKEYRIDSDDLAALMFCIASLSDMALKANASTCLSGVRACEYEGWDDDSHEGLCKSLTDLCQGFSEPIKEMSDRCADLTDRIVQKFRHEGQLYSTGSRLRD